MNTTIQPTIVLIGGISSSGKTSTAKALQAALAKQNKPFVHVPIDEFVGFLPPEWFNPDASKDIPQNPDGIVFKRVDDPTSLKLRCDNHAIAPLEQRWDDQEGPKVVIELGPVGMNLVQAYMPVVATVASCGSNIIIDGVFSTGYLQEAAKHFAPFRVYCIGIRCPMDIVEQRERSRGAIGGIIGLARGYALTSDAHTHNQYDLLVDTSKQSPQEAAEEIIAFMERVSEPQALRNLFSIIV